MNGALEFISPAAEARVFRCVRGRQIRKIYQRMREQKTAGTGTPTQPDPL